MSEYATSDGTTGLSDPLPTYPIIFVPGIMGTRLVRTDESGERISVWDPPAFGMYTWFGSTCNSDDLLFDYHCYPDEGWSAGVGDLPNGYGQDAHRIGHFVKKGDGEVDADNSHGTMFNIMPGYYAMLFAMAELDDSGDYLKSHGYEPRVYCAGYDFRKDNRNAADLLEEVINIALSECDADKVILVAHSMGGLVSRCLARRRPDLVKSVILIGSPSLGAPEAYLYLKHFHSGQLSAVLNLSAWQAYRHVVMFGLIHPWMANQDKEAAQHFSRYNMPALYQLAAGDMYAVAQSNDWLEFDDDVAKENKTPPGYVPSTKDNDWPTDCSDVDVLYSNPHTGFIDYESGDMQVQRNFLDSALSFHRIELGCSEGAWMHPETYIAYSEEHETIVGIKLDEEGNVEQVHDVGDGSVPRASGYVDDAHVPAGSVRERWQITGDKEHGALCEDAKTITWVREKIVQAITGG